jgi:rubrerythrin
MQWVASPARVGLVDPMDEHAMGRRMGEVDRGREAVRTEAERIMAPRTAEITAMREHNAAVAEAYNPAARVADSIAAAESVQRTVEAQRLKEGTKSAKAERLRKQADKWARQADVADTFE